ncbi:MAG: succinylglutamate desuccinylase/aspartoacylase family protein [Syntrophomonas sp.]
MKKVGKQLIHISIIFLLTVLTLSTTFLRPAPATAQSVHFETLASGTKYATKLYIISSNNPGPVVMFVGGVHGNEPAGFKAANIVKDYTITKGTLLVIPNANLPADRAGDRRVSGSFDLNRSFPQTSRESADNVLSKAIYNAIKRYDVDWLVDMHEGCNYTKIKSSSSVGQSLIYYPSSSTRTVAGKIISSINSGIGSSYRKFQLFIYPVKGSLSRSAGQFMGVNTFIFETCTRDSLSTRINYQLRAANILLLYLDMK